MKDYGFRDQITRADLSIPSNISEGYECDTAKDRARFLTYAKGSCGELRTHIYIGIEAGYIEKAVGQKWILETKELSKTCPLTLAPLSLAPRPFQLGKHAKLSQLYSTASTYSTCT